VQHEQNRKSQSVARKLRRLIGMDETDEPVGGTDKARRDERTPELAEVSVLVVDDDEDSRDFVVQALRTFGAKVTGAASACEALEKVASTHPDILLSDIGMPGEDGYSLIRRIRGLSPAKGGTIPAAAITAYTLPKDRERALAAGFQIHLAKPVTLASLITAAVSLVRMGRASPVTP
jgi:CheY-like chemotaxis protein